MNIQVFGDQTADQVPLLRKLCTRNDNALLTTFLELAGVAIREEVQRLPRYERECIPDFSTIADLFDSYHERGAKILPLESCLVTVTQLAHYIWYYNEHPTEIPQFSNRRVLGLCTGLLAASAVVSAESLSDLVPLGIATLRVAFRTGSCVAKVKAALDSSGESWSYIVPNVPEKIAQSTLDQFHREKGIQRPSQAYVSAISLMVLTISGPPATLRRLFEYSSALGQRHPIAVYGPYHASHLYHGADVGEILTPDIVSILEAHRPLSLIHSSSSGHCLNETTSLGLFKAALRDILCDPVRWDRLLEVIVSEVSVYSSSPCNISAFGAINVVNSLLAALRNNGHSNLAAKDYTPLVAESRPTQGRTQNDKIAIVGMAGRFPGAADHHELWDLLAQGLDVHQEVPSDRFDAQAHCDPSGKGKNKSHTPYGCFIKEPGLFDPRFFNMSPREAAQTDPMGRLALVTAYEALEMSGYVPNRTPSTKLNRIGTFYGQTSDDWREINAAEDIDTYFITGGVRAFAPGRINYYFKFSGPSFSIDTACSSSLAAIQLACTSLWAGDCDTACAGGLNVLTNPDIFSGLSKGQFLSKTGGCKTYDNDADGYCRGDGCATVILKRYSDAVADNDRILGSILGAATNHSAEAVSITHPHAGAQEYLYKKVLAGAGVDVHDVSYVEMHGTGTQAGDGIEMTSVTNVFAPRHRQRRQSQPLYLGAVKANIGHGEAASGVNSLCKVMMMMQKNAIPPNVGIKGSINQAFPKDLAQRNVHIKRELTPWPRHGAERRKVFLNNFSAAGGNTAIILEDGPLQQNPAGHDPRGTHIIVISARSIAALKRNIQNLIEYLNEKPQTSLPSLAYTTTARRIQHNYRVAIPVSDSNQVIDSLQNQLQESYSPISMIPTRVAFTFTGQGSQYAALGKKLFDDLPSFRADILQLDGIAQLHCFPSIIPMLNGSDVTSLSPVVVQLGMACVQVALAHMWASWGIKPCAVIGHSLGEYAALHVAGVISMSDMILLIGRRAELLTTNCSAGTHGMLAVKGSQEQVQSILGAKMIEVACVNGPGETVLCGALEHVSTASDALMSEGFKSTKLDVQYAFHSAQVEPILKAFKEVASAVVFNKPLVPVLSPLRSSIIDTTSIIDDEYLVQHARDTVNFWGALDAGREAGLVDDKTVWLEIGAHPVCSGLVKSCLETSPVTAPSLRRGEDPWKTLAHSLCTLYCAGVPLDFNEYHREFNDAHELLTLPTYSFDNKKYWLDYHHNWTLTKGEAPSTKQEAQPVAQTTSKLSTTSCQRIIREEIHANSGTVVVQSDLTEPNLHAAVSGHLVNDAPLCPSSLYADMAMTVADYLYQQLRPKAGPVGLNVCSMEVHKPLIAKIPPPAEGQHLQLHATANLEENSVRLLYRSVTPAGELIQDHGHGLVRYEDSSKWQEDWYRVKYMVQTQMNLLQSKVERGSAHKILRGMAYKLFQSFVKYSDKYQGMSEVLLDSQNTEASAKIKFRADENDGTFYCAPFWIDSMCHLSGFIINSADTVDTVTSAHISHGWGAMKLARPLSAKKEYQSYVRMQPAPNNVSIGDVYVFEGDDIVAVCEGLKFQCIPRRVLNVMLPPGKGPAATTAKASSSPVTKPLPSASKPGHRSGAPLASANIVKATKKTTKVHANNSITARVMKIIAMETDVDQSELVDDAAYENLGVDSLMSLTISARFREELDLEISSSLFTDYPTVGTMKKFFSQYENASSTDTSESDSSDGPSDISTPFEDETTSSISSPASSPPSGASKATSATASKKANVHGTPSIVRQIVSEEMGIDMDELVDAVDLSEIGMDSLMSLTILGSLRERTGVDLPSTFLATNTTIEDMENALGMRPKSRKQSATALAARDTTQSTLSEVNRKLSQMDISKYPQAKSVLLQGNVKTASRNLFLFPDGSGSATSYVSIAPISPDVAVIGMNCPFMKSPQDFLCGIDGVSALYLAEMKRRQPKGPYFLGGWSAGGVVAYEVANQLQAMGEKVEKLILIDSPCPVKLEPLPARLHHFFDSIGLLGTGKPGGTPDWLLPHFEYSIKALSAYEPKPMTSSRAPNTLAIWAKEGVCGNPGDPRPPPAEGEDPKPMKWLLDNRTDFGDNGWGQLLGTQNMHFSVMGGNHFTMMREEHSQTLGALIREGLGVSR